MNHLKISLNQPINKSSLRVWHFICLMALLWIGPLFIPNAVLPTIAPIVLVVWIAAYVLLTRVLKSAMRTSPFDLILIERFFVLLSFVVPFIYGLISGLRSGFGPFAGWMLAFTATLIVVTLIGIALHIKNASKYYHGVKKDELFQ